MPLAICPDCGVSITLPEGYTSLRPWVYAHMKTCPKGGQLEVVEPKKRRGKKGKRKVEPVDDVDSVPVAQPVEPDSSPSVAEEVAAFAAHRSAEWLVNWLFKGRK